MRRSANISRSWRLDSQVRYLFSRSLNTPGSFMSSRTITPIIDVYRTAR